MFSFRHFVVSEAERKQKQETMVITALLAVDVGHAASARQQLINRHKSVSTPCKCPTSWKHMGVSLLPFVMYPTESIGHLLRNGAAKTGVVLFHRWLTHLSSTAGAATAASRAVRRSTASASRMGSCVQRPAGSPSSGSDNLQSDSCMSYKDPNLCQHASCGETVDLTAARCLNEVCLAAAIVYAVS